MANLHEPRLKNAGRSASRKQPAESQADAREAPPDHHVFLAQKAEESGPSDVGQSSEPVDDPQTLDTEEGDYSQFPGALDPGTMLEVPESAIELLAPDEYPELASPADEPSPAAAAVQEPAASKAPGEDQETSSPDPHPASAEPAASWDAEAFILGNPLVLDLPFLSTRLTGARIASFVGTRLQSDSTLEVAMKLTSRFGALERPLLLRLHAKRQPLLRDREFTRFQVLFFRFILLLIGFAAGALVVGYHVGRM